MMSGGDNGAAATPPGLSAVIPTGSLRSAPSGPGDDQMQTTKQAAIQKSSPNSTDLHHERETERERESNGSLLELKSHKGQAILCPQHAITRSDTFDQQDCTGKEVPHHGMEIASKQNRNSAVGCSSCIPIDATVASDFTPLADQNVRNFWIGLDLPEKNRHVTEFTPVATVKTPNQKLVSYDFPPSVMSQINTLPEDKLQLRTISLQKPQEAQNKNHLSDHQLWTNGVLGIFSEPVTQMPYQSHNQGVQCSSRKSTDAEIKKTESNPKSLDPQMQLTNTGSSNEKCTKKESASRKRKLAPSPQIIDEAAEYSLPSVLGVKRTKSSGAPDRKPDVLAEILLQKNEYELLPVASVGVTSLNPSFNNSSWREIRNL